MKSETNYIGGAEKVSNLWVKWSETAHIGSIKSGLGW